MTNSRQKSELRPNLFIIGAMKSGTTSLHSYLDSHPQIFMSKPKEPMFFSREVNQAKVEKWYLDLFASAGDALIIGESSTEYTKAPLFSNAPRRIAKFNPEARFIYIMRDPIERTISHYWYGVRILGERRDMLTTIQNEPHYMDVSHYAMQLAPYFDLFSRDRIYTLTLEEMKKNASQALRDIFRWLGVDTKISLQALEAKKNVTNQRVKQDKSLKIMSTFRRSRYWKAIKPMVPRSLRSVGTKLSQREIDRGSISVDKVVEFLRPVQQKQTQALCEMLSRKFPEWKTLLGTASPLDDINDVDSVL